MQLTTFAICEQGERDYNDDTFADVDLMAGRCIVVADGAGGHRGGAIASRIATDTVMLQLASAPQWDDEALYAAIDAASGAVHARQREDAVLAHMSSTIVVLCIDVASGEARWTHLGDSRLYHFRQHRIERLTHDHSVLQSFLDSGLADTAGIGAHIDRSVLYAAVGAEGETRPIVGSLETADGDAFLLCTDGVWDVVPEHELEQLLAFAGSVQEWVESIGAAVARARDPAQDNYSAVGVWIGSPEEITIIK